MGLAIYNTILLELHFPLVVFKKLLKLPLSLDDILELDPALHSGFKQMLEFDGDVESTFGVTFTVEYEIWGEVKQYQLKVGLRFLVDLSLVAEW